MKYYAVTDDPRELYHYGVKGMKWGQHLFGDKPKSEGYKRAVRKLRNAASKYKENKIQKQHDKFAKAVQKQQRNNTLINNWHAFDNDRQTFKAAKAAYQKKTSYERKMEKAQKQFNQATKTMELNKAINTSKQYKKYAKAEKKMPKFMQQAREGSLRYGNLSDEQIKRIQDRFSLEKATRVLGSTEKPSWKTQKREARREGYLQGISKGTSAAMEEVARAGVQIAAKRLLDKKAKNEGLREGNKEKIKSRIKNNRTKSEIREDIKQEAREAEYREGDGFYAKKLRKYNDLAADRKFEIEEKQHAIQSARQQKELDARSEKALEEAGRNAYLYGYVPNAGNGGGGKGKGKQQQQQNIGNNDIKDLATWYEKKYVLNTTNQEIEANQKAQEEAAKEERRRKRKEAEERRKQKAEEARQQLLLEQQKRIDENNARERERYRRAVSNWAEEIQREQAERDRDQKKKEINEAAANYRKRQEARNAGESQKRLSPSEMHKYSSERKSAVKDLKKGRTVVTQVEPWYEVVDYIRNSTSGVTNKYKNRGGIK